MAFHQFQLLHDTDKPLFSSSASLVVQPDAEEERAMFFASCSSVSLRPTHRIYQRKQVSFLIRRVWCNYMGWSCGNVCFIFDEGGWAEPPLWTAFQPKKALALPLPRRTASCSAQGMPLKNVVFTRYLRWNYLCLDRNLSRHS